MRNFERMLFKFLSPFSSWTCHLALLMEHGISQIFHWSCTWYISWPCPIITRYTSPCYIPRSRSMCSLHSISDVLSVSLPYMAYHFATWIHHRSGVRGIRSLLSPTIIHLVRSVNAARKVALLLALIPRAPILCWPRTIITMFTPPPHPPLTYPGATACAASTAWRCTVVGFNFMSTNSHQFD